MKLAIVEGTPEEIAKAFPQLMSYSSTAPTTAVAQSPVAPWTEKEEGQNAPSEKFVSEAVARCALSRIELAPSQLVMLKVLYNAGEGYVFSDDLMAAVKITRPQFKGFMGAFGRRVASTPGHQADTKMLDRVWDYDVGTNKYRLPDAVRKAMELERLV